MNDLLLFLVMLKDSALSLGGYGPLPLIRQDLVDPHVVTDAQLVQALAIGRLSTGPNGLWLVSLGYIARGWVGGVLALVACSLPPLVIVPATTMARRHLLTPAFGGLVRGAALATAGLLIATGVSLVAPSAGIAWWQLAIAGVSLALTYDGRLHPGLVVVGGAAVGTLLAR